MLIKTYIKMTEAIRNFKKNESGVTAIEYGLIALAMAVFVVAGFSGDKNFVTELENKFSDLSGFVSGLNLTK